MMNPESKPPVTLENLLRLKRAERPAAEFWTRFEQELRAKQLAAIVEKRPWWNSMPRVLAGLRRYPLPLGASAVLAVTFVSVSHYRVAAPLPQQSLPAPIEEVMAAADAVPAPVENMDSRSTSVAGATPIALAAETTAGIVPQNVRSEPASGGLAEVLPWLSAPSAEADASMPAVQLLVATNLETVRATHPELARKFLGRAASFDASESDRKQAADPFIHLRGPAEIKRDRLLAKALPVSGTASWNGGERIARRLSEERLTEEAMGRIGAKADRLSLKF